MCAAREVVGRQLVTGESELASIWNNSILKKDSAHQTAFPVILTGIGS
jgi:hypothetical protein